MTTELKRIMEQETKQFDFFGLKSVVWACAKLNRGADTVRKMVKDGTLQGLEQGVGNKISIFEESVYEYIVKIKSPDFEYDNYHRNPYKTELKAKSGNLKILDKINGKQ